MCPLSDPRPGPVTWGAGLILGVSGLISCREEGAEPLAEPRGLDWSHLYQQGKKQGADEGPSAL